MNGERIHQLEVGDRVIARTNHCGRRTANRNPPIEHIGIITRIVGDVADVDCGDKQLHRNLSQLEYHPEPDVYEARKLSVRINHAWKMRTRGNA